MPVYYCVCEGVSTEGRLGSWGHLMSCGGPNSKGCLRNSKERLGAVSTLRSPRDVIN